jgi:glycine/D-amino acid oxidase-like deaminating enzyme
MKLRRDTRPFDTVPPAVSADGKHNPVSFWHETVTIEPGTPLEGDTHCDVAIVGGGFTGLSAARELKRAAPDLDVVLLEQGVVGHGASGRNGGFAMPLIGWDFSDVARKLGEDGAKAAYTVMYRAIDHLEDVVNEHNIACDLEATGYLYLATCEGRRKHLKEEVALGKRLGFDFDYLEGAALDEHIRSETFVAGAFDPHPVIINPAKLARGLKSVVENLDVRVYEQTPLEQLDDGDPVMLKTPRGVVKAKAVVLALNGYSASLGFMPSKILPVHTYIVLTDPLSYADLDTIGWGKKRTSLETARNFIHYFRLTADNRIVFGGEDADLYPRGALYDEDQGIFAALEARFREYFPQLNHVGISHRWGGVLGVCIDMLPTFGTGGGHKNIFHAAGYSGHGVSLSNYAGVILTPPILKRLRKSGGDAAERPFFYDRVPPWLPPDPWSYWGLRIYRRWLRALDRIQGA